MDQQITYLAQVKLPPTPGQQDPRLLVTTQREIWSRLEESVGQTGGSIHCAFGTGRDLWFAVQVPDGKANPTQIVHRIQSVATFAEVKVDLAEPMDQYFQSLEEAYSKAPTGATQSRSR